MSGGFRLSLRFEAAPSSITALDSQLMFEIGFWELALLFALGLIVLGPEKLPGVASQLGRYAGQARRMARSFTTQIRDEIEAEERRITAQSAPTPAEPPATYSRPGVDDLIPTEAVDEAPTPGTTATSAPDGSPPSGAS